MKIVCIRHGETDYNKKGLIQGQLDIPLNKKGKKNAKKLSKDLGNDFDLVYSSPLKRAYETAEIISKELNKEVIKDDRLKERDFGDLSGKKWSDFSKEINKGFKEKDRNQEYNYRPYGGESVEDVKGRVKSFVSDLKDKNIDNVLIVAHAGIIRVLSLLYSEKLIKEVSNSSVYTFNL